MDVLTLAAERLEEPEVDAFTKLGFTANPGPQTQFLGLPDENLDVLYGGAAGGSKGGRCPDRAAPSYDSSMETKVLTPKGFKLIGDVKVGDAVCNPDGTTAKVIKVTDNGPRQFYRVTLADGSTVEADDEHLWAVSIAGARKRRGDASPPAIPRGLRAEDEWNLRVQSRCRIVSTVELRELVLRAADDKSRGLRPRHVQIPLSNPVNLTGAQGRWETLSPYTLGALIGDGSLAQGSASICGIDDAVFERIRNELPEHLQLVRNAADSNRIPRYNITRRNAVADEEASLKFRAEFDRLLATRKWRQADLVAAGGGTQAYLSALMSGRKRPTAAFVAKLDALLNGGGSLSAVHADHAGASATDLLHRDGLAGTHSWDKFVPERIKLAPVADRFAFVQGLMDTDGSMDARGHVSYTTVSRQLATDMQGVLRSLGYRATLGERQTGYRDADGNYRKCRPGYALYVQGRHMDRLFHIPRKRQRVARFNGGDVEPWHRVESVEPTVVDNSRCIQVDNLNHLYLTDDYIVTHNSTSLLMYALRSCFRYPGLQAFWFRRSFPELEQSVLRMLARYGYAKTLGGKYNGSAHELRFSNDSILTFGHAKNVQEVSALQSAEINLLLIDERTTIPPDVIDQLYIRVRSGVASVPCLGIRSATNPGGVGHSRVKSDYVEATNHGDHEVIDASNRRRIFIQARVTDTPQLGEQYRLNLQGLDEKLRKAFLDGDWDVFAGQMFAEWRYQRHVVEPFAIPETWRRYNGIDWGWSAPWCTLWAALDEDGRVWVYREIYATLVPEAEQAAQILGAEAANEYIAERFADDAMWASRGAEKSIAAVYEENGVHLTAAGKGSGSRINGWQRIHSYLAEGPACRLHRDLGWDKCPMLHVFPQAENLIRTLPALPHAKKGNPEDADSDAEDHAPDALRYLLMNIGSGPQFLTLPDPVDPESQIAPLPTIGRFAYRPADTEYGTGWLDDDETPVRGAVQRSPFL